MHDAIVLANLINALPEHPTHTEIEKMFKAYKRERLPWVNSASNSSKAFRTMTDAVSAKMAILHRRSMAFMHFDCERDFSCTLL